MNSARSHRNFSAVYDGVIVSSARGLRENVCDERQRHQVKTITQFRPKKENSQRWNMADHRKTLIRIRPLHLPEPDLANLAHPCIQITITKRWTRSRGGDRIGTNYADGVAIVSASFYLRAVSSRLGHRKRYPSQGNSRSRKLGMHPLHWSSFLTSSSLQAGACLGTAAQSFCRRR